MRLLQLPVTELEQAIKEEIEKNPLLDSTAPENEQSIDTLNSAENNSSDWDSDDEDFGYDYHEHLDSDPNATRREFIISDTPSFSDRLNDQLISRPLTDRQRLIANELIGTLDDAGYLSRDLDLVTNDLAFRQGIDATPEEVLEVLHIIQSLEPAGIGARNLQECLLLQLERNSESGIENPELTIAKAIVKDHFDDFANHRYERICAALGISQKQLDGAISIIRHLNPKPGSSEAESQLTTAVFTPDIILQQHDGELLFYLNDGNLPRLSLNTYYTDMLAEMEKQKKDRPSPGDRETMQFLRAKQADAQGFIDLLQQRHDTIVRVMRYIVKHQRQFLLTGDPDFMQPLRQREVADATGLDISTISRMANSKYLQTDFGTIPLKDCFSKGFSNEDGEEVSVEAIKQRLSDAINNEDKHSPLSDDALTKLLNSQGFPLARRTVAKYREQLGFPIARLRRILSILIVFIQFSIFNFQFSPLSAQSSYYDSLIAIRLEAAQRQNQQQARNAQRNAAPANKKQQRAQRRPVDTSEVQTPNTELTAPMVPLWYTSFPHNRVNPMGRTRIDMMPDEIILKLVNDSSDFCFPIKHPKTSNYGWRWERGHQGVDIGLTVGEPIHCAFSGIVRVATTMGGYGNCIVVRHPNGLETLYGHLSKINVKPNQQVEAGEVIGLGGNTGNSTGPHLHFECRFLYQAFDPEWILDFSNYSLRTRRLHLDKSYFGIHQPRKGQNLEYKADNSIIKEQKNKRKRNTATAPVFDINDF